MDWWLSWTVRDYISLSKDQRRLVDHSIDNFHHWHRSTQLVVYADYLNTVKHQLRHDVLTPEDIALEGQKANQLWQTSIEQLLPSIRALFLSLSESQWQEFKQAFVERQEKATKPFIASHPEKYAKLRRDRLIKTLKPLIGKLSEHQDQLLVQWSHSLEPMAQATLQERRNWLVHADTLYRQRTLLTEEDLTRQLRALIMNESANWDAAYRQRFQSNQQKNLALISQLIESLNEKQKQKLSRELERYEKDLLYLSQKGDSSNSAQLSTTPPNLL